MTIAEGKEGGKALVGRIPADILIVLVLILSATLAFGLGVLAGKDMGKGEGKDGFWIEESPLKSVENGGGPAAVVEAAPTALVSTSGIYMASKNGTKYYLPSCGGSKRIKPENRVWFQTKAEAEAAGYGPAANCPGL